MTISTDALELTSEPRQRFPEFFVVGHQKCGTSALYEMLRRRPQIYMPDVKETWYFASELRSPGRRRRDVSRPESLAEYLSLFEAASPSSASARTRRHI